MLQQYIIAIAGSAGSMDPLISFFDHTPLNNASYVVLRHLPTGYKSILDKILKKHSKLKVIEASKGEAIENDKVYYAPSNDYLTISDGHFKFIKRHSNSSNLSIDMFLESLAKNENRRKAIAIILSGTASDGVKGAAAIKKAGGIVIVQSPDTCEFDYLPKKVIQSGNVDFVLDPRDMPAIIQGYIHRELIPKMSK